MLLDDLSDYLSTAGISTPVKKGRLQDAPDTQIAIVESAGEGSVHAMSTGPGRAVAEWPHVQVLSRDVTYNGARLLAHQVHAKLDGFYPRTLNGIAYKWVEAMQNPFWLVDDDNQRTVIACNYRICKGWSTT